MKMMPKLTQHQTQQQRIVMTPKLQQAIKVLMLPQYELSQFVEQEMQQNPLLEIEEDLETALNKEDYDPFPKLNTPEINIDKRDTEVDIDWHSVFDDLRTPVETGNNNANDPDAPEPDVAESKSLHDFLYEQLQYSPFTNTQRAIGEMIIDNLNDDGQFVVYEITLEDIASKVGCSVSEVEDVLQTIQKTFEPVGVAYRDIKETLCIQIDHHRLYPFNSNGPYRNGNDEPLDLSKRIVEEHFDDLLHNRITNISLSLGVENSDIQEASQWISTLSPYPGRYFTDPAVKDLAKHHGSVQGIIPDVQIKEIDGEYRVFPLDDYVPRLRINPYYINLMRNNNQTLEPETKKWIEQKYSDAADLLRSITQRGRTIERVTEAIFEIQSDFLTDGVNAIKPLTLKTVAGMAGVHESTVSRVTSSKYVETPQGTYPLKFFFSNQLATTHGKSVSAKQVKAVIQELISKEDSAKPLSDQAISNSLKEQGIKVARRTVQKYREELGILASRQRKKI